jgi:hypothetical protein
MRQIMINKITFKANIRFVTNEEFKKKTSHINTTDEKEKMYLGANQQDSFSYRKIKTASEGLTDNIDGCIAGGLTNRNSQDVTFFHYNPDSVENFESETKPSIYRNLTNMGAYTPRLGGLLVGGKSADSSDMNAGKSIKLADKLKNVFQALKASYSTFIGQNNANAITDAYYVGYNDTWYLNYKEKENPGKNLINSTEDLKKAYKDIRLANNDKVFINNQRIDNIELDSSFKKINNGYEIPPSSANKSKLNIYLGNYGYNRSILWTENLNKENIGVLYEHLDKIKNSGMFSDIQKIQYAGTSQIDGFRAVGERSGNKTIYEKMI